MSCDPQRVTALVDEALEAGDRGEVEAHVAECESCRAQVAAERQIRTALRELPAPEPPLGLEQRVRRRLRGRSHASAAVRLLLPLAAILVVALWARGYAPFVAWELSRDHRHCFSKVPLAAEVWGSEPEIVTSWFDERGERLPLLPPSVRGVDLVGGRFCRLADASQAVHLYYASDEGQVSVFMVRHAVRVKGDFTTRAAGNAVALMRLGRRVVGVVSDDEKEVEAFVSRLRTNVALSSTPHPIPPHVGGGECLR
jgi:anti-sigma factor RsiW